jgi:hypothetical protein
MNCYQWVLAIPTVAHPCSTGPPVMQSTIAPDENVIEDLVVNKLDFPREAATGS